MQMLRRTIVLDLSVAMGAFIPAMPTQAFLAFSSANRSLRRLPRETLLTAFTGLGVTAGYGWWYGA